MAIGQEPFGYIRLPPRIGRLECSPKLDYFPESHGVIDHEIKDKQASLSDDLDYMYMFLVQRGIDTIVATTRVTRRKSARGVGAVRSFVLGHHIGRLE